MDRTPYPPAIADLVQSLPLAPLGPGTPQREVKSRLEAVRSAFPAGADASMADACCAGLWLAFDFLDESHTLSQGIETPEGSYWHAILHRREPDAANSKYWWRRVGKHPVFAELAKDAAGLGYLGMGMSWDPFAFVDHCEEFRGTGGEAEETCRRVQRAEWDLLFDWCYRRAVGLK